MGKINKNMEHLQCCIVERWDGISDKLLDLYTLISWARFNMRLKRKLHLALMGGSLIMSEFQKVVVAERVLQLAFIARFRCRSPLKNQRALLGKFELKKGDVQISELKSMIDDTKQKDLSVTVYYNTLKVWWQELDLYQHIEVESTAYATRLAKMIERDQIFDLLPGLNPQLDHFIPMCVVKSLEGVVMMGPAPQENSTLNTVKDSNPRLKKKQCFKNWSDRRPVTFPVQFPLLRPVINWTGAEPLGPAVEPSNCLGRAVFGEPNGSTPQPLFD
uniref:Retrotransposon gag domain-containing protein n=1 Tax=Vitis vinifera TaxID=29760 RepID=A5AV88_VITVI|nr:hypothetical protein VITISV_034247 [Vitis vinifera]